MAQAQTDAADHNPLLGVGFLILATTLFPLQDVIIKSMSGNFAVHQVVVIRGILALPVVAVIGWMDGSLRDFRLGPIGLQTARAVSSFMSYLVYYMALATIGLAETAAITFSTPIIVTVLAVLFLGERVGVPRVAAVIVGMGGVVVMVQPGSAVFEPAAVLAVLAAVFYSIAIVITRQIGNRTNGASMTLFTIMVFILGGLVTAGLAQLFPVSSPHPSVAFVFRDWVMPTSFEWLLFVALGLISGIGFFSLAQAYRLARPSVVTPFEYIYLPWSVVWGIVFFATVPERTTWIGIALIVGSGLFILWRESAPQRRFRRRGLGIMRQR